MITRRAGYLRLRSDAAPEASEVLQRDGFVLLDRVFDDASVQALAVDIERVFEELPPDERVPGRPPERWQVFRYEMLNRSAACQRAIGNRAILDVIEPLLGEDCHVIANTAWWQPAGDSDHGGRSWHIDSGPHYGRRDIAQRLRPTAVANHLSDEAVARAATDREQTLIGLHRPFFYDG